jgi:NADP-dependent 3-hydroxy acid dehydrogenase YdfG
VLHLQLSVLPSSDEETIILTASTAASKGVEGFSVYSATKAAIRSFSRTWTDLKQRKIRANTISPGPIDPSFLASDDSSYATGTFYCSSMDGTNLTDPDLVFQQPFKAADDSTVF